MMHSFIIVLLAVAGVHQAFGAPVITRERLEPVFRYIDSSGDGKIGLSEYSAFVTKVKIAANDDNGRITEEELRYAIGQIQANTPAGQRGISLNQNNVHEYIEMLDAIEGVKDGEIDLAGLSVSVRSGDTNDDDFIDLNEMYAIFTREQ